jgi:hypothetical protein
MTRTVLDRILTLNLVLGMLILLSMGVLQYLFYRRLRRSHLEAWKAIGSPTFQRYNNYVNVIGRCIMKSEFRSLNDPELDRLALVVKVLIPLFLVTFLVGVTLVWIPAKPA